MAWMKLATRMKYKFMWMELDRAIEYHSHECTWIKLITSMDTIFFMNERKKEQQNALNHMDETWKQQWNYVCWWWENIGVHYIHYFNCMHKCDGLQFWSISSMSTLSLRLFIWFCSIHVCTFSNHYYGLIIIPMGFGKQVWDNSFVGYVKHCDNLHVL